MEIPIEQITKLLSDLKSRVILIDGRGGSGKSTIARKLQTLISGSQDAIVMFTPEMIQNDFDIDFQNRRIDIQSLKSKLDVLSGITILEGCFSFKLKENFENPILIWIDVDKTESALRLNRREIDEHPELEEFLVKRSTQKWQESEDEYILQMRPLELADVVLVNN
jgi:adenylate kinase family enzyme